MRPSDTKEEYTQALSYAMSSDCGHVNGTDKRDQERSLLSAPSISSKNFGGTFHQQCLSKSFYEPPGLRGWKRNGTHKYLKLPINTDDFHINKYVVHREICSHNNKRAELGTAAVRK